MLIVTVFILTTSEENIAAGESPSFARQEIEDSINDTISSKNTNYTQQQNITLPDIETVSYSSNGNHLNATIWLSSFFEERPLLRGLRYLMYIDVDTNNKTGLEGADYAIGIRWENTSGTWYQEFIEFSQYGKQKLIRLEQNSSAFFDEIGESVHFDITLDEIYSPDQYNIAFQIEDVYQGLYDTTSWLPIPPPEFEIAALPNSLVLRPGEEKNIELVVNSTTNLQPEVILHAGNNKGSILIDINPNRTFVPTYGLTSSQLHLKVTEDAQIRTHTIPIFADIHFQLERANTKGMTLNNTSYISISVLPKLTIPEYINSYLNTWGSPLRDIITLLTAIAGIGGAGISTWILNKVRKKKNRRKSSN